MKLSKPQKRFLAALYTAQTRPEASVGFMRDRIPGAVEYFAWYDLRRFTGGVTPQLPTLRRLQSDGLIETDSEDLVRACELQRCRCRCDAWRLTQTGLEAVQQWTIKLMESRY